MIDINGKKESNKRYTCPVCSAVKEKQEQDLCNVCSSFLRQYSSETDHIETLLYIYEQKVLKKQKERLKNLLLSDYAYKFEVEL
jgi:hypothetical protein